MNMSNKRTRIDPSWLLSAAVLVFLGAAVWSLATPSTPTPAPTPPVSTPTYAPSDLFDAVVGRNVPNADLVEARGIAAHLCLDLDAGMLSTAAVADAFNGFAYEPKSRAVIVGTASAFCPAYTAALSAEARLIYPPQTYPAPSSEVA